MENLTFNAGGFGQYLLSNQLIPPGKESYFVHWIRLFFTEKKRWPDYPRPKLLYLFIILLNDQSKLKDWQIHQANQAVRLYFENFLKDKTEISPTVKPMIAVDVDGYFLRSEALRVFREAMRLERLLQERALPDVLRVDNGPEFLSGEFTGWAEFVGMMINYIQPGEPNQNAYIERFNRTYRNEVLDLYLFKDLEEVREITYWWMIEYNEQRPHDSLDDLPPVEYMMSRQENSISQLSTK